MSPLQPVSSSQVHMTMTTPPCSSQTKVPIIWMNQQTGVVWRKSQQFLSFSLSFSSFLVPVSCCLSSHFPSSLICFPLPIVYAGLPSQFFLSGVNHISTTVFIHEYHFPSRCHKENRFSSFSVDRTGSWVCGKTAVIRICSALFVGFVLLFSQAK